MASVQANIFDTKHTFHGRDEAEWMKEMYNKEFEYGATDAGRYEAWATERHNAELSASHPSTPQSAWSERPSQAPSPVRMPLVVSPKTGTAASESPDAGESKLERRARKRLNFLYRRQKELADAYSSVTGRIQQLAHTPLSPIATPPTESKRPRPPVSQLRSQSCGIPKPLSSIQSQIPAASRQYNVKHPSEIQWEAWERIRHFSHADPRPCPAAQCQSPQTSRPALAASQLPVASPVTVRLPCRSTSPPPERPLRLLSPAPFQPFPVISTYLPKNRNATKYGSLTKAFDQFNWLYHPV